MPPAEFAAIALFAGRLNRLLARWAAANTCYHRAEDSATSASDLVTALRSRLGRAAVARGQGNLPLSRSMVQEVVGLAARASLREVEAMGWADLGAVLELQGSIEESVQAKYRCFQLTEDSLTRMRVLGDLGISLLQLKAYASARLAFEIVASSNTSFIVRTNAVLAHGSGVGRGEPDGLRAPAWGGRSQPRADAAQHGGGPPLQGRRRHVAVRPLQAGGEFLTAGLQLSEEHRLNVWYFKLERELKALEGLEASEARQPEFATPTTVESPVVEEVAVGLREYALTAS